MTSRYQKLVSHEDVEHNIASSSTQQRPQQQTQQMSDLQDTFGETFEEEEESNDSDRLINVPETQGSSSHSNSTPAILPVSSDGVFSNISAKPESDSKKVDETPPTYEEAAADATPPYWQTTIIAPAGMGDIVLVEGMPVGNIFSFFWNLMISASFQFVGFMLTYLLHTSHASKQGSRAGLGISLVQTGFYIRSRGTLEGDDYYNSEDTTKNDEHENSAEADIIAYLLMVLGWFIVIRSIADYLRAKQMEKIICSEPTAESIV